MFDDVIKVLSRLCDLLERLIDLAEKETEDE